MAYKRYLNDIFAKIDNQPSVFKSAVDLAQLNGTTLSVETGDYVEKLALNCPIVDNGRMVTMLSYQKAIDVVIVNPVKLLTLREPPIRAMGRLRQAKRPLGAE